MAYKPGLDVSYWVLYILSIFLTTRETGEKYPNQLTELTSPQRGEMEGDQFYLVKLSTGILKEI